MIFHWFLLALFQNCFSFLLRLILNKSYMKTHKQKTFWMFSIFKSFRKFFLEFLLEHFFSSLHLSASIKFRWIFRSKARYIKLYSQFQVSKLPDVIFLSFYLLALKNKKFATKVFQFHYFLIFLRTRKKAKKVFNFPNWSMNVFDVRGNKRSTKFLSIFFWVSLLTLKTAFMSLSYGSECLCHFVFRRTSPHFIYIHQNMVCQCLKFHSLHKQIELNRREK